MDYIHLSCVCTRMLHTNPSTNLQISTITDKAPWLAIQKAVVRVQARQIFHHLAVLSLSRMGRSYILSYNFRVLAWHILAEVNVQANHGVADCFEEFPRGQHLRGIRGRYSSSTCRTVRGKLVRRTASASVASLILRPNPQMNWVMSGLTASQPPPSS